MSLGYNWEPLFAQHNSVIPPVTYLVGLHGVQNHNTIECCNWSIGAWVPFQSVVFVSQISALQWIVSHNPWYVALMLQDLEYNIIFLTFWKINSQRPQNESETLQAMHRSCFVSPVLAKISLLLLLWYLYSIFIVVSSFFLPFLTTFLCA